MLKPVFLALAASFTVAVSPLAMARSSAKPNVVMYATQACGYCIKAREHFRARGVAWDERDVQTSAQAAQEFRALGGKGTPLIVIGDERIVGYHAQRIDAALARHTPAR